MQEETRRTADDLGYKEVRVLCFRGMCLLVIKV